MIFKVLLIFCLVDLTFNHVLTGMTWPNSTILYRFRKDFPDTRRKLVLNAISKVSSISCVKFQESTNNLSVEVKNEFNQCDTKCGWNPRYTGKFMNLGDRCDPFILHELLHTTGLAHEHSRYNRDKYLFVSDNGIQNQTFILNRTNSHNFAPFDFGSVMIYTPTPSKYFRPKNEYYDYIYTMGANQLSFYDTVKLNKYYGCNCPKNLTCQNNGYTNPSNCDNCICPDGFKGKLCETPVSKPIQSTMNWTEIEVPFGTTLLIRPVKGNTLKIEISPETVDKLVEKELGCPYQNVEIKYLSDRRAVNPLYCGDPNFHNLLQRSSKNDPTVILLRNHKPTKIRGNVTIRFRSE